MSSGLNNIGLSAILANQYALEVSSQNIANINNPNYHRQIPLFQQKTFGGMPAGIGIAGKERVVDAYINLELRNSTSSYFQLQAYFENAEQIDGLLSSETSDLSLSIQDCFASLQSLNNDPASSQNREIFFGQLSLLVDRFHGMSDTIDSKILNFSNNIENMLEDVNGICTSLAKVNGQLSGGDGSDTGLLDTRDSLLSELARYIHFTINEHSDGSVDVNMGKGISMVLGAKASTFIVDTAQGDFMKFDIKVQNKQDNVTITDIIDGGALGGLIDYRDEILSVAHAEIGRLAMAISDAVNKQNQCGMDNNSEMGSALFNDINAASSIAKRTVTDIYNTGDGLVSVSIDDMGKVTSSNYDLKIEAGQYQVVRKMDNNIVTSGAMGSIPMTIQVDGLNINLDSGTFNDGDKYLLTPTHFGAAELKLITADANKVALASPLRIITDQNNTGEVKIISTRVIDATNATFATPGSLNPPIRIEFLSDTSYQIVNANTSAVLEGPLTYDPTSEHPVFPTLGGMDPGYQILLAGKAQVGDTFTINYNAGGLGDNRNGYLLAMLQTDKLVNDGQLTLQQSYLKFSSRVSTRSHFADLGSQTANIVLSQSQNRRDSLSAVNIDEEAANLLRYQQAYQAAAQLLSISNNIFDMLFNAIAR